MDAIGARPVTLAARIASIDVLRGIALFGILVVNMGFFAGPLADAVYDPSLADAPLSERAAWFIENTFFTGKFVSLFSFLFGAGLMLQMSRMDAARAAARARGERGRSTALLIIRRMAILLAIGLAHALLLWYGDILCYYALIGWIVIPLRRLSPKVLATIALALAAVSFTCWSGMGALQLLSAFAPSPERVEPAPTESEPLDGTTDFLTAYRSAGYVITHPDLREVETRTYREGPFASVMVMRGLQWLSLLPVMVLFYLPHIFAMVLGGAAAAKWRLFDASAASVQRRVAIVCVPIGVVLTAAASWLTLNANFEASSLGFAAAMPISDLGAIVLALGYAALIVRFAHHPALGALFAPAAAAGRMALTVYLCETIAMTGLMYWWGFARFGTYSRPELFLIAIVTWLVLVGMSSAWLTLFQMGPMEWLWRAGTYLYLPPFRRRRGAAESAGEVA